MSVPFLDLKRQYQTIRQEVLVSIHAVLESQNLILGAEVEKFEEEVSHYCGIPHAVGVASGSDALLISLMALDLKPGDGVITSPFTFFATAGSISRLDCNPFFVDIEPSTFNMDPEKLREFVETQCEVDRGGVLFTRKTRTPIKAIVPVHLFGQCADMDPILEISKRFNLRVVEDAAQAIGSLYKSTSGNRPRFAGTMGDTGCFSFYPSKNLGAFGDGGMVISRDEGLAEKIRVLRVHGSRPKYYHRVVGLNSRLDALQAAILRVKLRYLDRWSAARRENALRYDGLFEEIDHGALRVSLPIIQHDNRHIFNQYVIRVPERDDLRQYLQKEGIGTDIYYPLSLHLQECFRHLGYRKGDFPLSEEASQTALALPIFAEITFEEQHEVVEKIETFYRS